MKNSSLFAISLIVIVFSMSTPIFSESAEATPKRFHMMLTGVPLFAPFANVGLDVGYDFWRINENFGLNAKMSGQYALYLNTSSAEISSASQSWGGDFSLNISFRLSITKGAFIFALGPTIGAFQEHVQIYYKSQATKETMSLQASDYQKILGGYNFGIFFETTGNLTAIFGISWTGLFNDTLQVPYNITGGPAGTYERRFIAANLLEFLAGIRF